MKVPLKPLPPGSGGEEEAGLPAGLELQLALVRASPWLLDAVPALVLFGALWLVGSWSLGGGPALYLGVLGAAFTFGRLRERLLHLPARLLRRYRAPGPARELAELLRQRRFLPAAHGPLDQVLGEIDGEGSRALLPGDGAPPEGPLPGR